MTSDIIEQIYKYMCVSGLRNFIVIYLQNTFVDNLTDEYILNFVTDNLFDIS